MPELPEVETVRRGLAPVMEGARFEEVEAHRGDLRWPLPKDFVARLQGQTVTGLGRRAKYLLADLSSGDVLLMHLGMSGSFRVAQTQGERDARRLSSRALGATGRTTTSCSACRRARIVSFNDPRRFGSMKLVPRAQARRGAAAARAWARAARQRVRCRDAGAWPAAARRRASRRRCSTSASSRGSATSTSARRCTARCCRRGGRPRPSPARTGAPNERAERLVDGDPGGARGCDRGRRLVAARSSPHRRLARRFPAQFPRLRSRGGALPDARLPRYDPAHRADRALDLLLPGAARSSNSARGQNAKPTGSS